LLGQAFKWKSLVSTFPHIKPRALKRTNINACHLRTLCADLFELNLSRFLDDSLFHQSQDFRRHFSGTDFQTLP